MAPIVLGPSRVLDLHNWCTLFMARIVLGILRHKLHNWKTIFSGLLSEISIMKCTCYLFFTDPFGFFEIDSLNSFIIILILHEDHYEIFFVIIYFAIYFYELTFNQASWFVCDSFVGILIFSSSQSVFLTKLIW